MRVVWKVCLVVLIAAVCPPPAALAEIGKGPAWRNQDVAWLERIASSLTEARKLRPRGAHARVLRTAAYVRLGAMGTAESLAAVERIEKRLRNPAIIPRKPLSRIWTHPSWHCGGSGRPLATTTAPDGKRYAIARSDLLGGADLFLTWSDKPKDLRSWSRPYLTTAKVPPFHRKPILVSKDGKVFLFSFLPFEKRSPAAKDPKAKPLAPYVKHAQTFTLADILRDRDKDGWTDLEEARMGLDPNNPDTDGDGIPDGKDPAPDYTPNKDDENKEDTKVLQKALFATFGLSGSRHLLLVEPSSRKLQLWGYGGPLIYKYDRTKWQKKYGYGGVFVTWGVAIQGDTARVAIRDWESPLSAGSQFVTLKKIKNKWIVIKQEYGPVS